LAGFQHKWNSEVAYFLLGHPVVPSWYKPAWVIYTQVVNAFLIIPICQFSPSFLKFRYIIMSWVYSGRGHFIHPRLLCDIWNWSDDTVSGIAILDTTAIDQDQRLYSRLYGRGYTSADLLHQDSDSIYRHLRTSVYTSVYGTHGDLLYSVQQNKVLCSEILHSLYQRSTARNWEWE